jgi:hypothetical protein
MSRRHALVLTSLVSTALAPLPASAHDATGSQNIARRLADPATQVAATLALTALAESLLDIKIEPFRRAMADAGDNAASALPRDSRLRDLAGPEADKLPGEIGRAVPQAMGSASGMVSAVQDMIPAINAAMDRLREALPKP